MCELLVDLGYVTFAIGFGVLRYGLCVMCYVLIVVGMGLLRVAR